MADVGRITELWRAAANALELPGVVEGTVPSQWLLDEKARRQKAEAECSRLREQLDAARQTAENIEAESVEVRRGTYWKVAAGEGDTVAVLIPVAGWQALRAALGVVGEETNDE